MKPVIAALLFAAGLAGTASADEVSIGLTTESIDVDADFSGAQIVLFGVIADADEAAPSGDIIAVVRGPEMPFTVRRIEKTGFFWTAGETFSIDGAPGLYLTSASRPIEEFAPASLREELHLGADAIGVSKRIAGHADARDLEQAAAGFIDAERRSGRYRDAAGEVRFFENGLFSIDVDLPPNTPVGDYAVDVFLIRDGAVVAADTAAMSVRKVGLERRIYELAQTQPLGYGVVCVAMSLFAGWLGAAAFRKP
ncbi:MAG: TIGR02186 family protein [Pseudomonadota bacterium]